LSLEVQITFHIVGDYTHTIADLPVHQL